MLPLALSGAFIFSKTPYQTSLTMSRVYFSFKTFSGDLKVGVLSDNAQNVVRRLEGALGRLTKNFIKIEQHNRINVKWLFSYRLIFRL